MHPERGYWIGNQGWEEGQANLLVEEVNPRLYFAVAWLRFSPDDTIKQSSATRELRLCLWIVLGDLKSDCFVFVWSDSKQWQLRRELVFIEMERTDIEL